MRRQSYLKKTAHTYVPIQKFDEKIIANLFGNLKHYAEVFEIHTGLHIADKDLPSFEKAARQFIYKLQDEDTRLNIGDKTIKFSRGRLVISFESTLSPDGVNPRIMDSVLEERRWEVSLSSRSHEGAAR